MINTAITGDRRAAAFTVPVDHDVSVGQLITLCDFDHVFILADIPKIRSGQTVAHLRPVQLGRVIRNYELFLETGTRSFKGLADPVSALHFAAQNPNEQRKCPMVTVWQNELQEYLYLYLFGSSACRGISVSHTYAEAPWPEDMCFLTVV